MTAQFPVFSQYRLIVPLALCTLLAVFLVLSGCDDDDDSGTLNQPLDLTILHINDHHSHLEPDSGARLTLAGAPTGVEIGGMPRVAAKIKELAQQSSNVVKIHAGDAITGTLYYSIFRGEADADFMKEICFDIFELGNHEFDDGDAQLKVFLDYLSGGSCNTAVLAANVVPQVGTPLAPTSPTDYLRPYVIREYQNERVGFIGIDIAGKTKNSSSPLPTTQFLDETETAQRYIDELTGQGVNKIVLVTHYQYENDLVLAGNLRGVDVIIGGDSHTLLGAEFASVGLNPQGPYPTQVKDASGNPVCIAQAWQYSNIVGELKVRFDTQGVVESCSGIPHLLLGDTFKRPDSSGNNQELTGSERQAVLDAIAADPRLSVVTPDPAAQAKLEVYAEQVEEFGEVQIGVATEDLCLERIPGQGRSQICPVEATARNGSDISNIVAQAFLRQARRAEVCIQNAGGVRIDIPAGPITVGLSYTLLPFANTLVEVEVTGNEIRRSLEDGVDYALNPNGSTGAYPYAAGLRYDVNLSLAKGSRISNVQHRAKGSEVWEPLDDARTYVLVTSNFIAAGGDGYVTLGDISKNTPERVVDTFLDYAQSFVDYVKERGSISKLPLSDYSTQNFIDADGNAR